MALGDFLGGVVDQRNTSRQLGIQEGNLALNKAGIGLRQRQQRLDQINTLAENVDQQISDLSTSIKEMRENGLDEERINRVIQPAVETIQEQAGVLSEIRPNLGNSLSVKLETAITTPTPTEQAQQEGQSERAQTEAFLGRETTEGERARVKRVAPDDQALTELGKLQREAERHIRNGDMDRALETQKRIRRLTEVDPADTTLVGDDGVLTTAATNATRGMVADLFGGVFDPTTGRIAGLDPQVAPRATAVATQAAEFIMNGDAQSIPTAVKMAGEKFGIAFPPTEDMKIQIMQEAEDAIQQGTNENRVLQRLNSEYGITREEFEAFRGSE